MPSRRDTRHASGANVRFLPRGFVARCRDCARVAARRSARGVFIASSVSSASGSHGKAPRVFFAAWPATGSIRVKGFRRVRANGVNARLRCRTHPAGLTVRTNAGGTRGGRRQSGLSALCVARSSSNEEPRPLIETKIYAARASAGSRCDGGKARLGGLKRQRRLACLPSNGRWRNKKSSSSQQRRLRKEQNGKEHAWSAADCFETVSRDFALPNAERRRCGVTRGPERDHAHTVLITFGAKRKACRSIRRSRTSSYTNGIAGSVYCVDERPSQATNAGRPLSVISCR